MKSRSLFAMMSVLLLAGACDDVGVGQGWSTDIRDLENPAGERVLRDLPADQIEKTLVSSKKAVLQNRPAGMEALLDRLAIQLAAAGIDATPLEKIADDTIGAPLSGPAAGGSGGGTSDSQFFDCPLLAPEQQNGTSCEDLVVRAQKTVEAELQKEELEIDDLVDEGSHLLPDVSKQFILAWALEAKRYGVKVAAAYAIHELRAAARCDTKVNAMRIAYNLGVVQGNQLVDAQRDWALDQVDSGIVNVDPIAEEAGKRARDAMPAFMEDNPICAEADLSAVNQQLLKADAERERGILIGIDQGVEVLRGVLFARRAELNAPPLGDPLVIDLDGDGLALSEHPVAFDMLGSGSAQRTQWVGPREGLVAIDLDGDGAITSAAELMSNRQDCNGRDCLDGAAALAAYDRRERGGNEDGLIDGQDAAFAQLRVWVDENQDGACQPGELATLASHGIEALHLSKKAHAWRSEAVAVNAELDVLTERGILPAYDVWFRVQLDLDDLKALLPRRR